ncbi:hypothetical protein RLIN73S_01099 [Rhodanobacter lindaniclasticus]
MSIKTYRRLNASAVNGSGGSEREYVSFIGIRPHSIF